VISLLSFLLFATLAIVGPGAGLQRLLRLRIDPRLILPLGLATCAAVHGLALASGVPWLFPLLSLALSLPLLRTGRALTNGPPLRGALAPSLGLLLVLALTDYPYNRVGPGGGFILDHAETADTAFHVGLTFELSHTYPPEVPGLAGVRLGYHIGSDLIRAAALRWAGIHPYDSLSRFSVTLEALALLLALQGAAWALGASPRAVALASWTLLLSDWSFLSVLIDKDAHWWVTLLDGNLLPSLILGNSNVLALAMALGSVLALKRLEDGEGRGWIVVASLLSLAVPFFKVLLVAPYLLALGVAFVLKRERLTLAPLIPCFLAALGLALGEGGRSVLLLFDPLALVRNTLDSLNVTAGSFAQVLLWSIPWLAASLGLRLFGLGPAFRAIRSQKTPAIVLGVLALAGWILGLLFRITLREQRGYADSAYFIEGSGAVLWIFAAVGLAPLLRGRRAWVVGGLATVLTLPSSLEFVALKRYPREESVPPSVVHAMAALEKSSRIGDVVLEKQRLPFPPPPLVFIGRRVAYTSFIGYLTQFAPGNDIAERRAQLGAFFNARDPQEALGIAHSLSARFLCLYEGDKLRFDPGEIARLVYEEDGTRVYAFSGEAEGKDAALPARE
jgi:hypothetical protein